MAFSVKYACNVALEVSFCCLSLGTAWAFDDFQGFNSLEKKEKIFLPPAVFSIKAERSLPGAHLSEEGPAMATDHIVIIDRFMCSRDS